jgi:hypothetical protein
MGKCETAGMIARRLVQKNNMSYLRRSIKMRPSSSFTGGMGLEDSGWVPEQNPFQQQQRMNPFLEDELSEMHPIQQQYLITKRFLLFHNKLPTIKFIYPVIWNKRPKQAGWTKLKCWRGICASWREI